VCTRCEDLSEAISDFINDHSLLLERIGTLSKLSCHIDGQPDTAPAAIALLETISELEERCEETLSRLSDAQSAAMTAAEGRGR
jgi:hypothetical protein